MTEARQRVLDFNRWLRTGHWVPAQLADERLEVKFNPYHDPRNGQFTFAPGGSAAADPGDPTNMARRPKSPARPGKGVRWGGGGFTGGGGGSAGGGGASGDGYWMNAEEVRAFRKRYPNREPHMVRPGETLDQIAAARRLSPAKLRRLNSLPPTATAQPGQILALPRARPLDRTQNASPVRKNGYTFHGDHIERTTHAGGGLAFAGRGVRSSTNQRKAGGSDRRADDDGGHFIAPRFNGPSDRFNHFAQNRNFNRGGYRVMEDGWAREVRAGHRVSVSTTALYTGKSRRPDRIEVYWTVDGKPFRQQFVNRPRERAHGR